MARRNTPSGRSWVDDLPRLFQMRDELKMVWWRIDKALNRPAGSSSWAYNYYRDKSAVALKRKELREQKPLAVRRQAAVTENLAATVQRPRYFHDADNFVLDRIARQGVTAGFLGDPPKGRSALDRRGQ